SQGAEIFATVGSVAKRCYLRNLGIKHVFDSRSLNYAPAILASTQGRGVDVVLNSLTGEGFIEATLTTCGPKTRFIEISKRSIWTIEQMQLARLDIIYRIVALDNIMIQEPKKIAGMLCALQILFEQNRLKPLPYKPYSVRQAKRAFSFMQRAKQIG